jgi:hypothetical protein
MNACELRVLLVWAEPRLGVSTPRPPVERREAAPQTPLPKVQSVSIDSHSSVIGVFQLFQLPTSSFGPFNATVCTTQLDGDSLSTNAKRATLSNNLTLTRGSLRGGVCASQRGVWGSKPPDPGSAHTNKSQLNH